MSVSSRFESRTVAGCFVVCDDNDPRSRTPDRRLGRRRYTEGRRSLSLAPAVQHLRTESQSPPDTLGRAILGVAVPLLAASLIRRSEGGLWAGFAAWQMDSILRLRGGPESSISTQPNC